MTNGVLNGSAPYIANLRCYVFSLFLLLIYLTFQHHDVKQGSLTPADLDPRVTLHYGIPSTASILAFDPIQSLLAIGTL